MYQSAFAMLRVKLAIYSEELFAPKGKKGRRGVVKSNNYSITAKINSTITSLSS